MIKNRKGRERWSYYSSIISSLPSNEENRFKVRKDVKPILKEKSVIIKYMQGQGKNSKD